MKKKKKNGNDQKFGKLNRLVCAAAAVILLSLLSACAGQESDEKSLREHGMDVIKVMEEMVKSSEYGSLIGSNADAVEEIRADLAAGDYTAPQAVYEIGLPSIQNLLTLTGGDGLMDGFSDALKNQLTNKSASSLVNLLNSRSGYAPLAAASVYTANKTFDSEAPTENTLYLYTFEMGYPVAVSFIAGEDRSVTASGTFLIVEDFDIQAAEQLTAMLKQLGLEVTIRQLP